MARGKVVKISSAQLNAATAASWVTEPEFADAALITEVSMKERVEEFISIVLATQDRTVAEVLGDKLVKDLWAENQTIVAEYKLLIENLAGMQQTSQATMRRLVEVSERERKYRGALELITATKDKKYSELENQPYNWEIAKQALSGE